MASSLPAPSAAAASPAKITVAAMAKSCVDTLVFTFNLRIWGLQRAGKPTPENSHKRGNHPLRLPFRRAGNGALATPDAQPSRTSRLDPLNPGNSGMRKDADAPSDMLARGMAG
jgi:hypothetical protein